MNNLYVYAIGGTGERVMKSFVMMLAAGVEVDAAQVRPIFIDNDAESKALQDCVDIIKSYRNDSYGFHQLCTQFKGNTFAQTKIAEPIILNKAGGAIGNLNKMIKVPVVKDDDPDLEKKREEINAIVSERDLLFTAEDLGMPLNRGFVARPNVGAVVMNTDSLKDLDITYADGDGLIVVGSLFGGTGASGIPLIINKNCHLGEEDADGSRPMIGAVAVLPYFNCERSGNENDRSEEDADIDGKTYYVNSGDFNIATRAALRYYDTYMKQHYDQLYYIGDDSKSNYAYRVGGGKQDNPVNLVEVMGALSIVKFSKLDRKNREIEYEQPQWSFEANSTPAESNLNDVLDKDFRRALVRFKLMQLCFENEGLLKKALDEGLPSATNLTPDILKSIIDPNHLGYERARGLKEMLAFWDKWCNDLQNKDPQPHQRNFRFFDSSKNNSNADKLLSVFYTMSDGFGITKMEKNWRGIERPEKFVFKNLLLDAFKASIGNEVEDARKLGATMLMISKAADEIIANHSTVNNY